MDNSNILLTDKFAVSIFQDTLKTKYCGEVPSYHSPVENDTTYSIVITVTESE